MNRVNIHTHIPQLLNDWGVPEFEDRNIDRNSGRVVKGGRRSIIYTATSRSKGDLKNDVVAIKVVNMDYVYSLSSSHPEKRLELLVEYFKRECKIWRRLDLHCHENIVPLLGFIRPREDEALPTLVMPYYKGGDLSTFLKTYSGIIDLTVKVQLMRGVAQGLNYMHSQTPPAIHRDLKASNVLVDIVSSLPLILVARITDFGSAKFAQAEAGNEIAGGTSAPISYPWAPPEYIKISPLTGKVVIDFTNPTTAGDIWSFGCTFLEVIKGKRPWDGYAIEEENWRNSHPPKPEDPPINEHCWNVMLVCWATDPDERPSAKSLVRHLKRIENNL